MAAGVARPVIMPLSNPTSQAEATPADLLAWTNGRALIATGSPFDAVVWGGRSVRVGQGNNAFVFPGLGLGVLVAGAREVSDAMCRVAAERLAEQVAPDDLAGGRLFPPVHDLRGVALGIAQAVVREARDSGLGRRLDDDAIPAAVAAATWERRYPRLCPTSGDQDRGF